MKFVCDEMLKRLGQWLRVAGYDVLMLPDGTDDRVLLERAEREQRLLLSSDRRMAEQRRADGRLVLLDCSGLDDCAAAVTRRLSIDWLHDPFSRCMQCNAPLVNANAELIEQVPSEARRLATVVRYCPNCQQLFWDGSHVKQMQEQLARWNRAADRPSSGS